MDPVVGALGAALMRSLRPVVIVEPPWATGRALPPGIAEAIAALGRPDTLHPGTVGAMTEAGLIAIVERAVDGSPVAKVYDASCLVAIVLDLQRDVQAARSMAHFDELTGILNRRGFDRQMRIAHATARRYGTPLGAIVFDLDGFKAVNDSLGHAAGDDVLRATGAVLRRELRYEVDMPGRLGGDEFAVGLPNTDLTAAHLVASRLSASIEDHLAGLLGRRLVGVSAGATAMRDAESVEDLLARADALAYETKTSKRGRSCARMATGVRGR